MRLRTKFSLVLVVVFSGSLVVTGWLSYNMLQQNARDEVIRNAGIMMEAALSAREYTVKQVTPLLEMQLRRVFLPQSVPAYAATEIFNELRHNYAEYTYKEATLNPTNPRDRDSRASRPSRGADCAVAPLPWSRARRGTAAAGG